MQPSEEQAKVIDSVKKGNNVVVDAVAGSGKSTTVLMVAQSTPDKKSLQITYNAALRKEVQEKVDAAQIANLDVHTYHSLLHAYYDAAGYTDLHMQRILEADAPALAEIPWIPLLIIDEAQDMTLLYFKFVLKFVRDMVRAEQDRDKRRKPKIQLLILGDAEQALYEFKGSDVRFLTRAAEIWGSYKYMRTARFEHCKLQLSYRVTNPMAEYVNRVMLGEERLKANKEGSPVQYISGEETDLEKRVVGRIVKMIEGGAQADEIFVLSGSVKGSFVRKIENRLVEKGIACYVPRDDQDHLDERVIKGKVVFSTYHTSKGRQRPYVFVLNYDSSYTSFLAKNDANMDVQKCPNTLYVGCTRASRELFVCETESPRNKPLPFLQMDHLEMQRQDYIEFVGIPRGPMHYESRESLQRARGYEQQDSNKVYVTPTKLIEFLGYEVIYELTDYVAAGFQCLTQEKRDIDVPKVVETGYERFEDVSDLNGIAIPCMFFESLSQTGTPTSSLYTITRELLDRMQGNQYMYLRNQFRERMPRRCATTADYMLSANIYAAVNERLYNKLRQIQRYDWMADDNREECMRRMRHWVPADPCTAIEKSLVGIKGSEGEEEKQGRLNAALEGWDTKGSGKEIEMSARADALTSDTLWEFKFVTELSTEHFLQVMIYAWIYRTLCPDEPDKKFCLFNIRTNEVYELDADQDKLREVMFILLRSKYCAEGPEEDADFVAKCRAYL